MLEASVTAIVGTIFVVTLRQALNLSLTRKFVWAIQFPNWCFACAAVASLFLHDERVSLTTTINIDWVFYTITKLVFMVGLVRLAWVVMNIQGYSDTRP
jgi:hypothetical protein